MISVVLRNVLRNLPRLIPMMVIIAVVFATMVVGNAVLEASGSALYETYAGSVAGDVAVSATGDQNFTLFGSDQLLIGEFLVPPVIPNFSELRGVVAELEDVRAAAGLISAAGNVDIAGQRRNKTIFGVDFDEYLELLPDMRLVTGAFPAPGQPGIVVQGDYLAGGSADALIGKPALIAGGAGRTFTLREVPVTGVFVYPVADELLDTVVLVDAGTARALAGYLYSDAEAGISAEDEEVLQSDLDDFFGGSAGGVGAGDADVGEAGAGGIDLEALFADTDADVSGGGSDGGESAGLDAAPETWNFLLLRLEESGNARGVVGDLADAGYRRATGYNVRKWYHTVGGNALLVRYLQVFFNIGLVFVAIGAAIIATNALLLSVLERTKEIGTMRALGAGRPRIAAMITMETLLVVIGAAVVGVVLGVIATGRLNAAEYVVQNQYITILFGGKAVRGEVTRELVRAHILPALALALGSVVYPLKRALSVSPREAMTA